MQILCVPCHDAKHTRQPKRRHAGARSVERRAWAELTDEERTELREKTDRYQEAEVEYRAAVIAEGEDAPAAPPAAVPGSPALDTEYRERMSLHARASLGAFIAPIIRGRAPSGAEAEYRAACLGDDAPENCVPLELFEPRVPLGVDGMPVEHRQDVASEAPAIVGVNQRPVQPFVFTSSIAPTLGIEMP